MRMKQAIAVLCGYFAERCNDNSTLLEILKIAEGRKSISHAKSILDATGGHTGQKVFEHACVKTLLLQDDRKSGFDPDSPYVMMMAAIRLSHLLNHDEGKAVFQLIWNSLAMDVSENRPDIVG